jgi:glycosyltransferase involved in cell wall biosynthesis
MLILSVRVNEAENTHNEAPMKIFIAQRSSNDRGSSNFIDQLSRQLEEMGHQIVDRKPDISLCTVTLNNPHKCPAVLRVDGIYYDREREGMNRAIKTSMDRANAVIYQSSFSKKMIKQMIGLSKCHSAVIHNGIDRSVYASLQKQKQSDHTFISCAHWRINKRPKEIARAFLDANITGSTLHIVGEVPKDMIIRDPKILYRGALGRREVLQAFKDADYMIHICHIDSCPNSVVEALGAGLPVVCNNISGTPEIVGTSGIVADIDPEFDFRFVKDMNSLPRVNMAKLTEAIRQITTANIVVDRPDLDIRTTAKEYVRVFESVTRPFMRTRLASWWRLAVASQPS